MAARFAQTTPQECEAKRLRLSADNTLKANKKCANILKDYLSEKGQDTHFETYDAVRLNEVLSHLYMDVRKPDGTHYKGTSLEALRNGINRYLKSPPHNKKFDIVRGPDFSDANTNFRAMMAEVKRMGLGQIDHHPVINEGDRNDLYGSLHMSPNTPSGLANKVQFDIRLYFFRRGSENMLKMTKSTFGIQNDPKTGLKYVTKILDEMTKNHRENDKENISGIMPECPGSPYCAVSSYEKYIAKLHPDLDRLWQKPLDSFVDDQLTWYCKSPLGEKNLCGFMTQLSKSCRLSKLYTNHSIRATGATILSKSMFGAAQIMAVTGHKSVQSLAVYQRVDDDEKIKMGQTLTSNIVPSNQLALPQPVPTTSNIVPSNQRALPQPVPITDPVLDYLKDIDLSQVLCDFVSTTSSTATCTTTQNMQSNPQIVYGNVTVIQNLTINK